MTLVYKLCLWWIPSGFFTTKTLIKRQSVPKHLCKIYSLITECPLVLTIFKIIKGASIQKKCTPTNFVTNFHRQK